MKSFMKVIVFSALVVTFVFGLAFTSQAADNEDKMIVVIGEGQADSLAKWISYLEENGFPVKTIKSSEFSEYKDSKYIVINAVPGDKANNGDIAKQILSKDEYKNLSQEGNRDYIIKDEVFAKDQTVVAFVGSPYAAAEGIRQNTKDDWIVMFSGWFDIELCPQTMYGY